MQILQQIVSALASIVLALQSIITGVPAATTQLAQVVPVATIALSPSSTSVTVSDTFSVNVTLNTGGQNIYGADIYRLRFDPTILQVVDADAITAGVQVAPGSLMPTTVINTVDNASGLMQFSQITFPTTTFNGSGTFATITFRTISAGTSNVTLDFALGNTTDTNVAVPGGDLLVSVGNGSYTATRIVLPPPPTGKFIIGDRVHTTAKLKVRENPLSTGKALCTQNNNAYGTIVGGPQVAGGYTWWQVNYDSLCDGWSVEDWLIK